MGTLTYDSGLRIYFNDWTLAHLQVAIGVKLHLKESFHLSWKDETDGDGGRGSIWIFPGAPLFFKFAVSICGFGGQRILPSGATDIAFERHTVARSGASSAQPQD
ncbi:hypothetical protein RCH12_003675 [Cryobacterium sp. MP_3.1]|uniref:DUF7882 family protein n=1 Tax=Cryobacterium sp. MP_3.1 TaxID=3071711 RepID=UPI002E0B610D|nr:hypothetical protein [Cryobacterium sp. MP_3.1]